MMKKTNILRMKMRGKKINFYKEKETFKFELEKVKSASDFVTDVRKKLF